MFAFEKLLAKYDFKFPSALIAQSPAKPRDSARLLVYSKAHDRTSFDTFQNLKDHLPPGAVLVLNDTKVIPARLPVRKQTGGVLKLLYVGRHGRELSFLAPQRLGPGTMLTFDTFTLRVIGKEGSLYRMRPSFPTENILPLLEKHGEVPLPPYIKHRNARSGKLKEEYQAVFAQHSGSVAAPTASLHFTKRLLADLQHAGHSIVFVTLHVNLGTFAPLTAEQVQRQELHAEEYAISRQAAKELQQAKKEGRPIIAVGTTVVRALESAATARGTLGRLRGTTNIFIQEGYHFKFVSGLITNFHVPRSSLLMLVSALVPRIKLLELYRQAIRRRFHLFSFGDGMLLY